MELINLCKATFILYKVHFIFYIKFLKFLEMHVAFYLFNFYIPLLIFMFTFIVEYKAIIFNV